MPAEKLVLGNVIDGDGLMALSDFVTDCGFNDQLAAGLKAKLDFVANGTANPSAVRHPRHSSKAHPGGTAHDLKNARHGIDTLYSVDVTGEVCIHQNLARLSQQRIWDC